MHTELCDRLGIEFPIFAFSHCRDVVAAVTKAGGFGVLGALAYPAPPTRVRVEVDRFADRRQALRRRYRHPGKVRGHGRNRSGEFRAATDRGDSACSIARSWIRFSSVTASPICRRKKKAAAICWDGPLPPLRRKLKLRCGIRRSSWSPTRSALLLPDVIERFHDSGRLMAALCGATEHALAQKKPVSTFLSPRDTKAADTAVRSAASCCGPR